MTTRIALEIGSKKVFAIALDWPGWCRSGRTEEVALDVLGDYLPRYAPVVERAGLRIPATAGDSFDVVERLPGNATTDFGAPDAIAEDDRRRLTKTDAERLAALLGAAWATLDAVVASAPPVMAKGPRGGGRDRDEIADHVRNAELGYLRKLGVPVTAPDPRHDALELLRSARDPLSGTGPSGRGKPVPVRYLARRLTWHVLDHAWEIEDKSS